MSRSMSSCLSEIDHSVPTDICLGQFRPWFGGVVAGLGVHLDHSDRLFFHEWPGIHGDDEFWRWNCMSGWLYDV